jgi:hypothetical protein
MEATGKKGNPQNHIDHTPPLPSTSSSYSSMFYFRSPKPKPTQKTPLTHDDIELATPPRSRGVSRQTSNRDEHHNTQETRQRRHHPCSLQEQLEHSNSSDHLDTITMSTCTVAQANTNAASPMTGKLPPLIPLIQHQQHQHPSSTNNLNLNAASILLCQQPTPVQQAADEDAILLHP